MRLRWLLVACLLAWQLPLGAAITVSPPSSQVGIGETVQFTVIGGKGATKWTSDNPAIASVVSTGVVTGRAEGWTTIRAKRGNEASWAAVQTIIRVCRGVVTNCTTPGTLTLAATFDNISVVATFTGDNDADNGATLQYRESGSGTWLDAYAPATGTNTTHWPDRRTTVSGGTDNAAYVKQFRGSILDLDAGTTYEVRVAFNDPDGVTIAPLTGSVTLLSSATLVQSGATYYLDDVGMNGNGSQGSPFNSLANAMAGSACGDTILVQAGTYAAGTLSKSCTSTTWLVVECASSTTSTISEGTGSTPNLTISGDYIQVKNCGFAASSDSVIVLSSTPSHIWLEGNQINDVATGAIATDCNAAHYADAGIQVGSGADNVWLIGNTILGPHLTGIAACSPTYDGPGSGIDFAAGSATGTHVVKNNTITGGFRDCIGNSPENTSSHFENTDVIGNTIRGCKDDGIQLEGSDANLRIGHNTVIVGDVADGSAAWGWSCLAFQTGYFSPIYVWRNYLRFSGTQGGTVLKVGGAQGLVVVHNTMDSQEDGIAGDANTNGWTVLNNILQSTGNTVYQMREASNTLFDYNQYYRPVGTTIINSWEGSTNYTTTAAFFAGEGQEQHGQTGNPLMNATTGAITSSSPAYNVGVPLANLNDATASTPAVGLPDMGAFEVP